jgi:thioredoxin 1
MRIDMNRSMALVTALWLLAGATLWAQSRPAGGQVPDTTSATGPQVTFVELGSVKCIPCRQMQPVMKAIEEKYRGQVNVVFYDVWKEDQRAYGKKYGVRIIPTQVFLDKEGKEFFRHEGFFPESEIDKLLQKRGLTPRNGG